MAKGKNILTTGDVARICNVAARTVSKWFDTGQLKGYRIPGSKDRRIPLEELIRFMKQHNMPLKGLSSGKVRVLIISSNKPTAQSMAEKIAASGQYELQLADNNFAAGLAVQRFNPHVLVIDLLAGQIDAVGICRSIRNDPELQTVKVIASTGRLSPSERQVLFQIGFDECIEQGAVEELTRAIEQAVAIVY
ncbi:MAG: helix-turn-helix domain-containing protein [Sedimentisphaerales bacterium]|jgi:excisionase family DNA binding protein|nr:helix-turn-helix domain-containing protein [Sedimentisphaerales bacterium]